MDGVGDVQCVLQILPSASIDHRPLSHGPSATASMRKMERKGTYESWGTIRHPGNEDYLAPTQQKGS